MHVSGCGDLTDLRYDQLTCDLSHGNEKGHFYNCIFRHTACENISKTGLFDYGK